MAILKKIAIPALLLILGGLAAMWLLPRECAAIQEQFIGYPDSHRKAHYWRVYLLALLCALPFICAVIYQFLGILDRYTLRIFFTCFLICFGALLIIMILEDLQDNLPDFQQSKQMASLMMRHYLIKLPALIVFLLPYSLMLSLLWALGKMSKTQEVVAIIQTGRGVVRMIYPLIGVGVVATIICLIFNYYWAPHAVGQEKLILAEAKGKTLTAAHSVAYENNAHTRHWYVGTFPLNPSKGEPLRNVSITTMKPDNSIDKIILTDEAIWSLRDQTWRLKSPIIFELNKSLIPPVTEHEEDLIMDWIETPFQIIKPGLKAPYLGVPGLKSWLSQNYNHPLSNRRAYETHLYYRYAQPFICIIIVLLAAPLGVVFNRRGAGGGIAVAIFLCAGMIFCSTIFPTLGESGYLPPFIAAWATNILFTLIALILFYRRMTGRPIYQTIKHWLRTE